MNEHLGQPVREVVELLVSGRYAEIEALTEGVRLSALEMMKAITDYGRQLVIPPD